MFAWGLCVQIWVIAKHFSGIGNGAKARKIFFWLIVSFVVPPALGVIVTNLIVYPAYDKQNHKDKENPETGKILIATFTPLSSFLFSKIISRFAVQGLWRISHPGRTFVYLVPLYYGSAIFHFSRVVPRLRWVVELFRVVATTENIRSARIMPYNQEVITFIQRDDRVISVYGGTTMFYILVYYVSYEVPGLPGSTEGVHSSEDRR